MKKFIYTFLLFLGVATMAAAQGGLKGIVLDADNEPAIGATVMLKGANVGTATEYDGTFSLANVPAGDYTLNISYVGFADYATQVTVGNSILDLGTITLKKGDFALNEVVVTGIVDVVKDRRTPVAVSTISNEEIQAKAVGNVEFPEVMKNTPSVYVSGQTGFGDSKMFTRGFGQSNTAFLLNGQPINGMEDGKMYWSNWSGMSDVASAVQVQRGLGSSKLAISSVGGTINILTKTVENKEGGFARFMMGNDSYFKGSVAYNTGLKNKWAFSFLLDHWQGNNKWAKGTKGQGQNYFMSVGYKPNDSHTFNFLVTGAPQNHGQRWSQKEEKLKVDPKFNQHWGTHDGKFKSERFNYYHKPILNLSWDYKINNSNSVSSVMYASFGRGGGTGPYGSGGRIRTDDGQIDFDAIQSTQDTMGIGSYSGGQYARRASINNHQWFGNVTSYKTELAENLSASVGADFRWYTGDHFRQLVDLFGLKGWNDAFKHATRPKNYEVSSTFSTNPWQALTNFASEKERIAYDYSETINYQGGFAQVEYALPEFTVFAQGAVSNQSYQREGRWADQGKSKKINKIGYNIKGGASYSPNENHTVFANGGYYSRQPFLDNIFENVRYSNDIINTGVENEDVVGVELGYKYFAENFAANLNLYNTKWGNRVYSRFSTNDNGTPDDDKDDFSQNTVIRGITQVHRGIELDAKYKIDYLTMKAFATFGDWVYKKLDKVSVYNDDTGALLSTSEAVDIDGVHVPSAPQTSFGLGLDYDLGKNFTVSLDANYYDRIYMNSYSDRKTPYLTKDWGTLDPYVVVDFGIGHKVEISDKQALSLRLNVYNLFDTFYLNNTDAYGVLNGNGRTWNVSAKYSF